MAQGFTNILSEIKHGDQQNGLGEEWGISSVVFLKLKVNSSNVKKSATKN